MSLFLDEKYIRLIGNSVRNFKKKGDSLYNFSCPICGDSKKNASKSRGYLFPDNRGFLYKCHNCGVSMSFKNLLKHINPVLYREYVMESMKENLFEAKNNNTEKKAIDNLRAKKTINLMTDSILSDLYRVDLLEDGNECKEYVRSRLVPQDKWHLLYYSPDFMNWINSVKPNTFQKIFKEARLVFPILNTHGKVLGVQARVIGKPKDERFRFMTISFSDKNTELIFGLDRVDYSKPIYVTEGITDSLFLPNSLAVLGSSYKSQLLESIKPSVIIVPDNEKRNKQVCENVEIMLKRGFKVAMWDSEITAKDVNDAIKAGISQEDLLKMFQRNTVSGLSGLIKYKTWISS